MAKVVYFTRVPARRSLIKQALHDEPASAKGKESVLSPRKSLEPLAPQPNGFLEPKAINGGRGHSGGKRVSSSMSKHFRRRSSTANMPGGRLNFVKYETDRLDDCIEYIATLISSSSASNGVSLEQMKKSVKIIATGGGAHLFYDQLQSELGVQVVREEEMDCLITGLSFITEIPNEVFSFSDELVDAISHPGKSRPPDDAEADPPPLAEQPLPRPSPNPPQYSIVFESHPTPQFPCLLVNIGSGVSIIRVDEDGKFERVSGTSLGGGTLWGILSLLTGAKTFDGASLTSLSVLELIRMHRDARVVRIGRQLDRRSARWRHMCVHRSAVKRDAFEQGHRRHGHRLARSQVLDYRLLLR